MCWRFVPSPIPSSHWIEGWHLHPCRWRRGDWQTRVLFSPKKQGQISLCGKRDVWAFQKPRISRIPKFLDCRFVDQDLELATWPHKKYLQRQKLKASCPDFGAGNKHVFISIPRFLPLDFLTKVWRVFRSDGKMKGWLGFKMPFGPYRWVARFQQTKDDLNSIFQLQHLLKKNFMMLYGSECSVANALGVVMRLVIKGCWAPLLFLNSPQVTFPRWLVVPTDSACSKKLKHHHNAQRKAMHGFPLTRCAVWHRSSWFGEAKTSTCWNDQCIFLHQTFVVSKSLKTEVRYGPRCSHLSVLTGQKSDVDINDDTS